MHWGFFDFVCLGNALYECNFHLCAGDVALHALTDAILGALCLPDIGQLFPDTDPKWKGANSDTFIKEAVGLIRACAVLLSNMYVHLCIYLCIALSLATASNVASCSQLDACQFR